MLFLQAPLYAQLPPHGPPNDILRSDEEQDGADGNNSVVHIERIDVAVRRKHEEDTDKDPKSAAEAAADVGEASKVEGTASGEGGRTQDSNEKRHQVGEHHADRCARDDGAECDGRANVLRWRWISVSVGLPMRKKSETHCAAYADSNHDGQPHASNRRMSWREVHECFLRFERSISRQRVKQSRACRIRRKRGCPLSKSDDEETEQGELLTHDIVIELRDGDRVGCAGDGGDGTDREEEREKVDDPEKPRAEDRDADRHGCSPGGVFGFFGYLCSGFAALCNSQKCC